MGILQAMNIHVLTLFPNMFQGVFGESITKRAVDSGLVNILIHNIRDYSDDKHLSVDDYPFGGGGGMVMKPEPIFKAVNHLKREEARDTNSKTAKVVLLTPQGEILRQGIARELSTEEDLILICGRYEGVDERVSENLVDMEISVGDYVLSGGEIPAMALIDAVIRLIPGVVGGEGSFLDDDSHFNERLQFPQYTRPSVYGPWNVPEVLLSGDHGSIARWRRLQSILRTMKKRPDLIVKRALTTDERQLLEEMNDLTGL